MLKILYIVGDGSTHENAELRWSLRSVEKWARCDVEPVIVGSVPEWFRGNAVEATDADARKEKNIFRKIDLAIEEGLVEGLFQISADDHFWTEPTDFEQLPVYFRQDALPSEAKGGNNYEKALVGTRDTLLAYGYPAINTTVHCNQWANTLYREQVNALRLDALARRQGYAYEYGLASWAVWPNVLIANALGKPIAWRRDIKIRETTGAAFLKEIEGAECFSINDRALECPEAVKWMEEEYGKKSRWEK